MLSIHQMKICFYYWYELLFFCKKSILAFIISTSKQAAFSNMSSILLLMPRTKATITLEKVQTGFAKVGMPYRISNHAPWSQLPEGYKWVRSLVWWGLLLKWVPVNIYHHPLPKGPTKRKVPQEKKKVLKWKNSG